MWEGHAIVATSLMPKKINNPNQNQMSDMAQSQQGTRGYGLQSLMVLVYSSIAEYMAFKLLRILKTEMAVVRDHPVNRRLKPKRLIVKKADGTFSKNIFRNTFMIAFSGNPFGKVRPVSIRSFCLA